MAPSMGCGNMEGHGWYSRWLLIGRIRILVLGLNLGRAVPGGGAVVCDVSAVKWHLHQAVPASCWLRSQVGAPRWDASPLGSS